MLTRSFVYLLSAVWVILVSGCFSDSVSTNVGDVSSSEYSSDEGSSNDTSSNDDASSDNASSVDYSSSEPANSKDQVSSSQVSYDGGSKGDTESSTSVDTDGWGFEADMENVETMRIDVLYRNASGSIEFDNDDAPLFAKDTLVEYIPVPFYLDYRFIGEGWMGAGAKDDGLMTMDRDCEAGPVEDNGGYIEDTDALEGGDMYTPHTDLCKHYVLAPDFDDDEYFNNWGGVAWLWKSNWGRDLENLIRIGPGATKISFWAKSARDTKTVYNDTEDSWGRWFLEEPENSNASFEHNHSITIAACGNDRGSCDWEPEALEFVVQLSEKWQYFELPLSKETVFEYRNMANFSSDTAFVIDSDYPHLVSSGFMWINAKDGIPGDDPLDFFIDRIRYSDEPLYGDSPGTYETTVNPMDYVMGRNTWGDE